MRPASMRAAIRLPRARLSSVGLGPALLLVLCASFLAGAVLGSAMSSSASPGQAVSIAEDGSVYGYGSFLGHLLGCARYHLVVLLFATSVFGAVLIPAAMAVRGFVLSCAAASLAVSYPGRGVLLTAVVLGIPAAFTVPALFMLAFDGMLFSTRLAAQCMRRPAPPPFLRGEDRVLAAVAALFAAAAVECFVVPPLVRLII